ncbi:MAG TPA: 3-dehydroquinate synthase [Steroidobacteraceae bacterium]|nr:3-dehydroquinate synthase [Steroidobacteraceae bacterium]
MKIGPSSIARPSGVERLTVELGERSYPILIGPGLLNQRAVLEGCIPGGDLLLVSNTVVAPLYAERVAQALAGRRVFRATLPDGEAHKTLTTVSRLLDVLVTNRLGRDAAVVALGGGVVGDIAGFTAACYQRGIAYVQAPTTLLAQVDSSVGGKTGVNHPGGKNLIGAFHQPVAVVADTSTLETLPPRELRAGLAEIIKYGLIRDATLYEWVEASIGRLLAREPPALAHAIRRSCEIKAEIVGCDEREQGERALLNLGHTFGHALEAASGYRRWLHGEAVGAGLLMAASMSQACGTLRSEAVERLRGLLERTGLPTAARGVPAEAILEHMKIDKKVKAGRIRLVLLRGVGDAYVTGDYPDRALEATVRTYCG